MSDLFAPPTPEELAAAKPQATPDVFAPPTPEEVAKASQKPYAPVESGAMGAVQGLSMQFAPAIGGASSAIAQTVEPYLGLAPKDDSSFVEKYRKNRDYIKNQMQIAQQQNPKSYLGGDVAGSLATAAVPGLGEVGAVKSLPALGQAVTRGAVQGGLMGLGSSEADLTKGEVGHAAYDTAKGALVGSAVGGASHAVAQPLANKLSQLAEQRAFKAATGNKLKVIRDAAKTGKIDIGENGEFTSSLGRDLLSTDEAGAPVIRPTSTAHTIAADAGVKQGYYGAKIGEVANEIDKQIPEGVVDGSKIGENIERYIQENIPENPANNAVRNKLQQEADFYKTQGKMSFANAQKFKNTYNFKPTDTTTQVLGQDATNAIKRSIGQEMDDTADALKTAVAKSGTPEASRIADLLDKYQMYKKKYGSYATASKAATDQSLRDLNNRGVSPSDYGMGAASALLGGVTGHDPVMSAALGAAGAGVNKLARTRGNSLVASGANSLAEALSGNPAAFGPYAAPLLEAAQKGNQSLALTHYLLMRNDPRYRQQIESMNNQ